MGSATKGKIGKENGSKEKRKKEKNLPHASNYNKSQHTWQVHTENTLSS
jgi:hypothetical protein